MDGHGFAIENNWQVPFTKHMKFINRNCHRGNGPSIKSLKKFCVHRATKDSEMQHIMLGWQLGSTQHIYEDVRFRRLFGSESVMVYQPAKDWKSNTRPVLIPLDYISDYISRSLGSLPEKSSILTDYFCRRNSPSNSIEQRATCGSLDYASFWQSLRNLYQASLVFEHLGPATINPTIASHPLHEAKWVDHTKPIRSIPSRPEALALIATFESGGIAMKPRDFEDVIAISSGSSLYVAEALLNDPVSTYEGIRCLVGNVGKPGMVLLLSPDDPMVKPPSDETWEMVNHDEFDGQWEDNFQKTTLHLKLTGYEAPLNVDRHGGRYKEVVYMKAVVSAHARGEWIADINVLSMYSQHRARSGNWLIERLLPPTCDHTEESKSDNREFGLLTSIDNWPELLDLPPNTSVVRAKGNWDARLALAAVMRMRNDNVIIVSGDMCWACAKATANVLNMDMQQLLILC
jgi:hypothetical protein